MHNITEDIFYVGVDDRTSDIFEGLYKIPNGVSYNSYVIKDEKTAVLDTVDKNFGQEWLKNVKLALNGKRPDYLIIHHMEPDHSANILKFAMEFPDAVIVGNNKTFVIISEFFGTDFADRRLVVTDGEKLALGRHELTFLFAPMVHWPEVMFGYDSYSKILFSADAFGKFGASDAAETWQDEARRYYFGIVGKYGAQVQSALKKTACLDIEKICPLHGPILSDGLGEYLNLYNKWSLYEPEEDGIMIAYASVYGNTAKAAELLANELKSLGVRKVACYDLTRSDRSLCVAEAFRYGKLALVSATYNGDIFPSMREFIDCLTERNFQGRTVAFMENGSWAPAAAGKMRAKLENCKNLAFAENRVKILSALNEENISQIKALAKELAGLNG